LCDDCREVVRLGAGTLSPTPGARLSPTLNSALRLSRSSCSSASTLESPEVTVGSATCHDVPTSIRAGSRFSSATWTYHGSPSAACAHRCVGVRNSNAPRRRTRPIKARRSIRWSASTDCAARLYP